MEKSKAKIIPIKSKAKISDFGGQEIIKGENGKLYRLPDYQEVEYVEQAKEPKRLELKYKDILHWYYKKNILYPKDRDLNDLMFAVGYKYQLLWISAGYNQRVTPVLVKDHIQADIQATLNFANDCQTQIMKANQALKKYKNIVVDVCIDNLPAKKKLNEFREGLQVLVELWK